MKRPILTVLGLVLLAGSGCSQGNGSPPGAMSRWWASLRARFSNGRRELESAMQAKQKATSWRMRTVLKTHPGRALETVVEVSCPDRERIVTALGDNSYESVRVGGEAYSRGGGGGWTRETASPDWYPCGDNPGAPAPWAMMNEGRDTATVIAKMAESSGATVTAGPLSEVDKTPCRQWVVSFQHPGGGGRGMSYTVCLGTEDHLPRQVVMGSGGMVTTYSDWNTPIQIAIPPEAQAAATVPAKTHQ